MPRYGSGTQFMAAQDNSGGTKESHLMGKNINWMPGTLRHYESIASVGAWFCALPFLEQYRAAVKSAESAVLTSAVAEILWRLASSVLA